MNKKILIILMAFMLLGTSTSLAYSVQTRPLLGELSQEEMGLIVKNLQQDITTTQQYVNSGIAKFETITPDYASGYNDVSLALKGFEKIETHLKRIDYKGKVSMKANIKKTKAATYLLKGFIECAYYKDYKLGQKSLKQAIKYDFNNSIESLLNESAQKIETKDFEIAEIYLTTIIENPKLSNKEKGILYKKRGELRENNLNNIVGANLDYEKYKELIKI